MDQGAHEVHHVSAYIDRRPAEVALGGIDLHALGYECEQYVAGGRAAHVFLRKRA